MIGQQLAEHWAETRSGAKAIGGIDQMIVLNGTQGVSELLAQTLSQGVAGLSLARKVLGAHLSGAPPQSPSSASPVRREELPRMKPEKPRVAQTELSTRSAGTKTQRVSIPPAIAKAVGDAVTLWLEAELVSAGCAGS